MTLKAILDSVDDLPDAIKAEYKEQTLGGKKVWVLDVGDVDTLPTVVNLKTAHERQKNTNKELKEKLEAAEAKLEGLPEDFTAEMYEAAVAKAEGKPEIKEGEQAEKVRQQLEAKHAKEQQKKDERIAKLEGVIQKSLIDDALTSALVEAGVDKSFLEASKALLKGRGNIKLTEDDDGFHVAVSTDMGDAQLPQFIKDWSASDEGKVFVSKPTGGGAMGGDGKKTETNPWLKDKDHTPNLTEQGMIVRADKDKARRLMKAAGYTDAQISAQLGAKAA